MTSPLYKGRALSINNPNRFCLAFPTNGNTTDDCNDPSKVVTLGHEGTMTSEQIASTYGTSQPTLPIA